MFIGLSTHLLEARPNWVCLGVGMAWVQLFSKITLKANQTHIITDIKEKAIAVVLY